ncbi:hypothetical protein ACFQL4_19175 [Halosimplex aquaticum]
MTGAVRPDDRAISTVVDVTFALLLVSASIAVLAIHITDDDAERDTLESEQTAQTLSATTLRVEYSLQPVVDDPDYSGPSSPSSSELMRASHGPVTDLLAAAAITRVRVADDRVSQAGEDYLRKMQGNVRDILTSADAKAHVVAVWRPYEGSAIQGRAEAGPAPPQGTDLRTVTLTVDSRIPSVSDGEIESRWATGDYGGVARLLADAIVRGYFPRHQTQLVLERGLSGRRGHLSLRTLEGPARRLERRALQAHGDVGRPWRRLRPERRAPRRLFSPPGPQSERSTACRARG